MSISLVTVCKGRLENLKETISSWIEFGPEEIIVVDVQCPDGTKDWLARNHPEVRCVSLVSPSFNLAQSRNEGAKSAVSDYIFFVDADIVLNKELSSWLEQNTRLGTYYSRKRDNAYDGIHEQGTVLCHQSDFKKVQGYDSTFCGYGGEDHDLYFKLQRIGVKKIDVPKNFINSLDHADEMRTEFYVEKNKFKQSIINRSYSAIKAQILAENPRVGELPQTTRSEIWNAVNTSIKPGFENLEGPLASVKFSSQKWAPEPYYLEVNHQVSISIKRRTQ